MLVSGFLLVELIHTLKRAQKLEEKLWISIAVASLIISGFAFVSFIVLSRIGMFYKINSQINSSFS